MPVYRDLLITYNDVIHVSLILLCVFSFFQQSNNSNNTQIVQFGYNFNEESATTNTLPNQQYQGRTTSPTNGTQEMGTLDRSSAEDPTPSSASTERDCESSGIVALVFGIALIFIWITFDLTCYILKWIYTAILAGYNGYIKNRGPDASDDGSNTVDATGGGTKDGSHDADNTF